MKGARIINRQKVLLPQRNVEGSQEYQRAYEKSALAIREFKEAQQAYRARRIGDAEFLRARAAYDKAMAEYDAAYAAEQERQENPYAAIASPHELFYRAHQGLSGSWDVRRAGYHGKLEILESGLTEPKARALAASANAEIRTEREAFFETQPLGSFVAGHNPKYVTQRDVNAAAQTYHNNLMAYGENNMATQRAEWKYRELQRTYNEQKTKRKERAENPAWFGYYPRFVPEGLWNELVNLWHLSRVPFSGVREGARYKRMLWTSDEFHKEHPEISSTAAYKDLDGFLAYSGK